MERNREGVVLISSINAHRIRRAADLVDTGQLRHDLLAEFRRRISEIDHGITEETEP